MDKVKIYKSLPVTVQHVITSIYGYKLKRLRYSKLYRKYYSIYQSGALDQESLLYNLLIHLKCNVGAYRKIQVDKRNVLQSFYALNETTKETLRNALDDYSHKTGNITLYRTSGTTGKNLIVYNSDEDKGRRMAYLDYIKSMHGVPPFSKRASFTGNEIITEHHNNNLWRYNFTMKQVLYASYYITNENVKFVYNHMAKNNPLSIDGLPSAIHMVAQYILRNNIDINWNVRAVFPTAETMLPHVKEEIARAFNTVVIDQYASSEGAPFIYSGREGQYHVGTETGLFEFYRVSKHIYDMVVTSYINYATPLIRYRIGDQVEIESDKDYLNSFCDNIRIKRVIGRGSDYLIGENKQKINSVNVSWIIDGFEEKVIQFQVIQKSLKLFLINMVVEEDFDRIKDERDIKARFKRRFGNNEFVFNYLNDIPKEKSGKVRFIINEMRE